MGWFEATLIFVTGLITFMVILPIGQSLLPMIQDSMGSTVVVMISAMFVLIIVGAFVIYMRQSKEPDHFMGGEGPSGEQY